MRKIEAAIDRSVMKRWDFEGKNALLSLCMLVNDEKLEIRMRWIFIKIGNSGVSSVLKGTRNWRVESFAFELRCHKVVSKIVQVSAQVFDCCSFVFTCYHFAWCACTPFMTRQF